MPSVLELSEKLYHSVERNASETEIQHLLDQGADPFLSIDINGSKTSVLVRVVRLGNHSYFDMMLASKKCSSDSFAKKIPHDGLKMNFLQAIAIFGTLDMLKAAFEKMGKNKELLRDTINKDVTFRGGSSAFVEILISGIASTCFTHTPLTAVDGSVEPDPAKAIDFLKRWKAGKPLTSKEDKAFLENGVHVKMDGRLAFVQYLLSLGCLDIDCYTGTKMTIGYWLHGMAIAYLENEKLFTKFLGNLSSNGLDIGFDKTQERRFIERAGGKMVPQVTGTIKNSIGIVLKVHIAIDLSKDYELVEQALAAKALAEEQARKTTTVVVHQRTQSTDETLQQLAARVDRHSADLDDLYAVMDKRALAFLRNERRGSEGSQGSQKSSGSETAKSSPQHSEHDPLADARVAYYMGLRKYLREKLNETFSVKERSHMFESPIWSLFITAASIGTYAIPEPTGVARAAAMFVVTKLVDKARKHDVDQKAEAVICDISKADQGIDAVEKLAILIALQLTGKMADEVHKRARSKADLNKFIASTCEEITTAIQSLAKRDPSKDTELPNSPLDFLTFKAQMGVKARLAAPLASKPTERRASKGGPSCAIS